MKIRFLQDFEGRKRGDIVESSIDGEELNHYVELGIIEICSKKKQIKDYPNKMMISYLNK